LTIAESIVGQAWLAPPLLIPASRITKDEVTATNRYGPTSDYGCVDALVRPLPRGTTAAQRLDGIGRSQTSRAAGLMRINCALQVLVAAIPDPVIRLMEAPLRPTPFSRPLLRRRSG
jgi:hypothetical protein